jgi:hypothetical protein
MRERPPLTVVEAGRILDFDSECRPMHYSEWRAESQITGIAWSWIGEDKVDCVLLQQNLKNERAMLKAFLDVFNQADMVTGHYLRKHDLPLINDHCIRLGFPVLKPILVCDTMSDLRSVKGLGKSQENLSVTFGISAEKHHMTGAQWRVANALTPAGVEGTRTRVIADVLQNKQLRQELLDRGLLKSPKVWRP